MNNSLKNKNLFREGLSKRPKDRIMIGGADLSDLPSKEILIDQKIEEAKEKALSQSQIIIEEAEKKAAEIIEAAEANKDAVIASAHEEGYKLGYQDGLQKANDEVLDKLQTSKQILEAVEKERLECIEDEGERIYKVICLIAKKLIKYDLQLNKTISINFINEALKKLEYKSEVNILINPFLAQQINQLKDQIKDSCPGLNNITITASEALEPGDLILESNKERLDFRLDSQLDELVKEICK